MAAVRSDLALLAGQHRLAGGLKRHAHGPVAPDSLAARLRDMLPAPVYLAWILREDVRRVLPADPERAAEAVLLWWVLFGRHEFANREKLPPRDCDRLWAARPSQPGGPPTMPLLAQELWRRHPEQTATLGPPGEPDRNRFLRWVYTKALRDYRLADTMPPTLRDWLHKPQTQPKGVTRHALMLWEQDEVLFDAFDLNAAEDVRAYANWYAAHDTGLEPPAPAMPTSSPLADAAAPPQRFGARLVGFARSEFGVGEDVRMAALSCAQAGIPYEVEAVTPLSQVRHGDATLEPVILPADGRGADFRFQIFCLTALDTAQYALSHPDRGTAPYRIGIWPWELPHFPEEWAACFDLVDEVWAVSRFTHAALAAATVKPVLLMPPAVALPDGLLPDSGGTAWAPRSPERRQQDRARWGLPQTASLFVHIFDINSFLTRKNPLACLAAFQAAFPPSFKESGFSGENRRDIGLVLKVIGDTENDPMWRALRPVLAADPRVHLIEGTLDRTDLLNLLACCDALLSLHRAEGFGRTLAEAMLLGLPVVGTDWSGNRDFLNEATGFPVAYKLVPVAPGEYPGISAAPRPLPPITAPGGITTPGGTAGDCRPASTAGSDLTASTAGICRAEASYAGNCWAEADIEDAARQMRRLVDDPATAAIRARAGQALMLDWHSPARVGARYRARLEWLASRPAIRIGS
jgi:glycosyltransferase involved in cell wall biosynthesis